MFGKFIKQQRLAKKLTLRNFCRQLNEDASNWSKVERGKISPPQDKQKLSKIASILGIVEGSQAWQDMFDYSAIDAGKIPDYLLSDKEIIDILPVFFRTVGNTKPTPEELKQLITTIRNNEEKI